MNAERRNVSIAPDILASVRNILAEDWIAEHSLEALARALVPSLGEWCLIDARADRVGESVGVVVAHENAEQEQALRKAAADLARGEHLLEASSEAFHERRMVVGQGDLVAAFGPAGETVGELHGDTKRSHIVAVPLLSRGRLVGVLALGRSEPPWFPWETDLALELASRIAMAVDLARESRRLARSQDARNDMIGTLAHDLRTPLSTLSMVVSRLKKNAAVQSIAASETQIVARNVHRIESMLRNLVDCSRLESGKLRFDAKPCDLSKIVRDAVEAARATAGGRALTFDGEDGPFEVVADAARLRQVVDHLLANAIKFTPETNGAVTLRIERLGSEVIVSVADTGPGIEEDKREQVFMPSWELTEGDAVRGQGPRLGLYVSRGLVEAQGGRLWVESESGRGSTFSFSVPRSDTSPTRTRSRGPILVIDDDSSFRNEVSELLRGEGFPVVGAPHGRAALDYLRSHDLPSLVLLDLTMPIMDGWELYREMKRDAQLASVPVVVVSGLSRTPAERALLGATGREQYLEKPLRLERLIAVAQEHYEVTNH